MQTQVLPNHYQTASTNTPDAFHTPFPRTPIVLPTYFAHYLHSFTYLPAHPKHTPITLHIHMLCYMLYLVLHVSVCHCATWQPRQQFGRIRNKRIANETNETNSKLTLCIYVHMHSDSLLRFACCLDSLKHVLQMPLFTHIVIFLPQDLRILILRFMFIFSSMTPF